MMKEKAFFTCQTCGYQTSKWMGRCPDCGQWSTLVEERIIPRGQQRGIASTGEISAPPLPISKVDVRGSERIKTDIGELDRVLGGGIVKGSMILIGGDPGIGKSTLLLQTSKSLSEKYGVVLYVSGEESQAQIKMRGERIGITSDNLLLLSETSLDIIEEYIKRITPGVLIIDSIQAVYMSDIQSAPGSVTQVRECAARLMGIAKGKNIPTFIVGHVTKDGAIAGPRVLEHIVDTVLYFEGERNYSYRILRAVKNRFGSTNEIGVFEMRGNGLEEVKNPSQLFLSERPLNSPGSVIVASLEGTRPILVELQALVSSTNFGMPRRVTIGVDYNRVCLLLAVLEKRGKFPLQAKDIFINVAGGVKIDEPASDLGIVMAVASSFFEQSVDSKTVILGEVGLTGEVRAINGLETRLKEASFLGFESCLVPSSNLNKKINVPMKIKGVMDIEEALSFLFKT